jgi:hypothetical protein
MNKRKPRDHAHAPDLIGKARSPRREVGRRPAAAGKITVTAAHLLRMRASIDTDGSEAQRRSATDSDHLDAMGY